MKRKQNSNKNARFNAAMWKGFAFCVLALFALVLLPALAVHPGIVVGSLLFGSIGLKRRNLFFDRDDRGSGVADWSEDELEDLPEGKFRAKVLGGVGGLSQKIKDLKTEIDANIGQWSKENKTVAEAFTVLKNKTVDLEEVSKGFKKFLDARQREVSLATASLSPIRRIQADPLKRAAFNLVVRMACNRGDLNDTVGVLAKDLDSGTAPGSTLINTHLLPEIFDTLSSYGIWNTLGVRRVGTKTISMPVKTARVVATWIDEAAAIGADNTKAGQSESLNIKKVAALIAISRELLQDAEFDVTADVLDDFGQAIAYRFDYSFFVGNGVANNLQGGFTGLFNAGTASVAAATHTTVGTLSFDDFIKVLTSVAPVVLQRQARWWAHPTMIAKFLSVRDGNGRPIFLTALEAPTYGGIGSILGYPVTPGHALPTTDAAASPVAAFGDGDSYVVGLRQDAEISASDHANFETDERAFRAIARAGGKLRRADAIAVLKTAAA